MGRKIKKWIFLKPFVHTNVWTGKTRSYAKGEIIDNMQDFLFDNAMSSVWPYRAMREGIVMKISDIKQD